MGLTWDDPVDKDTIIVSAGEGDYYSVALKFSLHEVINQCKYNISKLSLAHIHNYNYFLLSYDGTTTDVMDFNRLLSMSVARGAVVASSPEKMKLQYDLRCLLDVAFVVASIDVDEEPEDDLCLRLMKEEFFSLVPNFDGYTLTEGDKKYESVEDMETNLKGVRSKGLVFNRALDLFLQIHDGYDTIIKNLQKFIKQKLGAIKKSAHFKDHHNYLTAPGPFFKQCADYLNGGATTEKIDWEHAPDLPQLSIKSYEYLFDDDTFLGVTKKKTNSDWTEFIDKCVNMPCVDMNA